LSLDAGEASLLFAVIATAILDRLLHHSHVISVRGESHRLRDEKRAGPLKAKEVGREG
jgi:DNA replication protein DnaC